VAKSQKDQPLKHWLRHRAGMTATAACNTPKQWPRQQQPPL